MSSTVRVQLDAVSALAAELAALAAELDDDAGCCRSTVARLAAALSADEGWAAAAAGMAWAALVRLVAARTHAVAATLAAAVDSYRAVDAALADRIPADRIPSGRLHAVAVRG
jgi:hypothetical protein